MNDLSDIVVVGAGIVGLSTALRLVETGGRRVLVLEAEDRIAAHQTGHNSGVIHSGIYYKPGSLKARNCQAGREALYRFCQEHGIPAVRCGKIIVATEEAEIPFLRELASRGEANGLRGLRWLEGRDIAAFEPHASGRAALLVPETGIVDYRKVSAAYAGRFQERGGQIVTRARVVAIRPGPHELVLATTAGDFHSRFLVNCAGLQSDRVARLAGAEPGLRIIPFRGDYYVLAPQAAERVKALIYPVPNPRLPFLGVHLTRMIDGKVEAGPNAVLAFKREGYARFAFSWRDTAETLAFPGFYPMARQFLRVGLEEYVRAFSKRLFAAAVSRLLPGITVADLAAGGAGVRAQAVERDGRLVDDFRIVEQPGMVHVLNAPSPAATASLSIGETIAQRVLAQCNSL